MGRKAERYMASLATRLAPADAGRPCMRAGRFPQHGIANSLRHASAQIGRDLSLDVRRPCRHRRDPEISFPSGCACVNKSAVADLVTKSMALRFACLARASCRDLLFICALVYAAGALLAAGPAGRLLSLLQQLPGHRSLPRCFHPGAPSSFLVTSRPCCAMESQT